MILKFYEVVLSNIRESIKNYSSRVSNGSMQTHDEYRWLCGKIKGLQETEAILCEVFDSIHENPSSSLNNNN